ncbi:hypothetical protein BDY17DRAFT_34832 [Neohortaea acidophila]|uniref:Uncharacterized protein n=1 Tax=Neohortaea acidophila TaxID=245834 RepID=A0A6A6PJY8_9PEZI|nr:uncharacterized protein BDY17DRAFT_34832 [Neohortaea acidophila]KAF2480245.1 hypothetical protein BDY17DRAFT_34832 [Neohortaea acidophila]
MAMSVDTRNVGRKRTQVLRMSPLLYEQGATSSSLLPMLTAGRATRSRHSLAPQPAKCAPWRAKRYLATPSVPASSAHHPSAQNQAPHKFTPPSISKNSPSNKPGLRQQRDHSACGRPETPLKVRKTRENLKQCSIYADIPPPCMHGALQHAHSRDTSEELHAFPTDLAATRLDTPPAPAGRLESPKDVASAEPALCRQKSVRRRMLTKVKQGITNRARTSPPGHSSHKAETRLLRKWSGRRTQTDNANQRSQSFEISRDSIDSSVDECFESATAAGPDVRSFTGSTVSTAEVLRPSSLTDNTPSDLNYSGTTAVDASTPASHPSRLTPSSPSPLQTPRPLRRSRPTGFEEPSSAASLVVPCVDLEVSVDCSTLDVLAKRDLWVAIKATVQASVPTADAASTTASGAHHATLCKDDYSSLTSTNGLVHGQINTLRLCYRPLNGSRIRDTIGHKTKKNLSIGDTLSLFVKLHVPEVSARDTDSPHTKTEDPATDHDSLFTELESIVGTLETEILHVEARYRHSLLPSNNTVTVRHVCRMNRPRTDCRWSMITLSDSLIVSSAAQMRLARYLSEEHGEGQALELMHEYLDPEVMEVGRKSSGLRASTNERHAEDEQPSVIITDVDREADGVLDVVVDQPFSTAPSTPSAESTPSPPPLQSPLLTSKPQPQPPSQISYFPIAPPLLTAPRTTTALSNPATLPTATTPTHLSPPPPSAKEASQDTVRALWHHIRRSSLSAKQLGEMLAPEESVKCLEAGDEGLRELRQRALSNKRSVGAETLRGWKWEGERDGGRLGGEGVAPWM